MKKLTKFVSILLCMIILLSCFNSFSFASTSVVGSDVIEDPTQFIPDDAYPANGHTYKIFSNVCDTWEEAKEYCENLGGHLATIGDYTENINLMFYMRQNGTSNAYFGLYKSQEGDSWNWVTGEPVSFTRWKSGEPNNLNREFYGQFDYSSEFWNNCDFGSNGKSFICEWDYQKEYGDLIYNGHIYRVYDNVCATWEEAKEYCEKLGGHLATLTSQEENDAVYSYVRTTGLYNAYIGLSDVKTEGTWEWVTGEPFEFNNWGVEDPDNGKKVNEKNGTNISENYVQFLLTYSDGTWADNDFCNHDETPLDRKTFICEWDSSKRYPDGYDFKEDSYNFKNYSSKISQKYFTTMYEEGVGELLYEQGSASGLSGLCFGMVYTTASIYNGLPKCSDITTGSIVAEIMFDKEYCSTIREINNNRFFGRTSSFNISGNTVTIDDFIKYSHIYQCSVEASAGVINTFNDIEGFYNTVKEYTDNNEIGVALGFINFELDGNGNMKTDVNGRYITSGHEVLAVGYEGRDILIDDPNNTESLERLTINDDWSWSYSGAWTANGVNSNNTTLDYAVDYYRPYQILLTGEKISSDWVKVEDKSVKETYIEGINRLDADSTLLYLDCDSIDDLPDNVIEIRPELSTDGEGETTTSKGTLYWVKNDSKVTLENISGEDNTVKIAGDNTIITVEIDKADEINAMIDGDENTLEFKSTEGENCSITFSTVENNQTVAVTIEGIVDDEAVKVEKTDGGVTVKGLSSGTIDLSKDDIEIKSEEFNDKDSSFGIVYDDTGKNDDLIISFDSLFLDFKFIDVPEGKWFTDYIKHVYVNNLFNGVSDTEFKPNESMSRAMFVTVLSRLAGESVDNTTKTKFDDVQTGRYYTGAIKWAEENGIVTGVTTTTFKPNDTVTREQMCAMLVRYAEVEDIEIKQTAETLKFEDENKISNYAKKAVEICQKSGIVNGVGDNKFDPKSSATRAQVAKILTVFHKNYIVA